MKLKKWKAIFATLTTALAISAVGGWLATPLKAGAVTSFNKETLAIDYETVSTQQIGGISVTFGMDSGASVRISSDETKRGIRFSSYIVKADYDQVIAANGSIGTIIAPKQLLIDGELTHEVSDYVDIPADNYRLVEEDKLLRFNGVLKVLQQNYGLEFSARAYVKIGDEYVYSAYEESDNCRSVKNVALDAIANEDYGANAETGKTQLSGYLGENITVEDVKVISLDETRKFGYLEGETRSLPVAHKENYIFDGWVDEAGNKVDSVNSETTVTELTSAWKNVMPDGVIENFNDKASSLKRYCVGTGAYPVAPSLADKTEWLETKELGGVTKSGVLHVTLAYGHYLTAQFTRTAEELEALGVRSITFTMGWTATSSTTGNSLRFSGDNAETGDTPKYAGSNNLNSGAWETVTITIDELNAYKRFGGNAWNTLGSDGANKNWLIRCAYYSTTVELYIDEITCIVNRTVPEGYLEDFGESLSTQYVYVGSENGSVKNKAGEWLESYTVGSDTRQGVLKVEITTNTAKGSPALWLQFSYTEAELEALNIESITITLAAKNEDGSNWMSLFSSATSGDTQTSHGYNDWGTSWREITIPVSTLKTFARFKNADGSMNWKALSNEGTGAWLLRSGLATVTTLYIDSITYTVATAE